MQLASVDRIQHRRTVHFQIGSFCLISLAPWRTRQSFNTRQHHGVLTGLRQTHCPLAPEIPSICCIFFAFLFSFHSFVFLLLFFWYFFCIDFATIFLFLHFLHLLLHISRCFCCTLPPPALAGSHHWFGLSRHGQPNAQPAARPGTLPHPRGVGAAVRREVVEPGAGRCLIGLRGCGQLSPGLLVPRPAMSNVGPCFGPRNLPPVLCQDVAAFGLWFRLVMKQSSEIGLPEFAPRTALTELCWACCEGLSSPGPNPLTAVRTTTRAKSK